MTKNEASTPPTYRETWAVVIGRETFFLNEKQIAILKSADQQGRRGIVWFDEYAISIPHINAIYRVSRQIANQLPAGDKKEQEFTPEQRQKALEKLAEIRKNLATILHSPTGYKPLKEGTAEAKKGNTASRG